MTILKTMNNNQKCDMNENDRKHLFLSARVSHAYTWLMCGVHA